MGLIIVYKLSASPLLLRTQFAGGDMRKDISIAFFVLNGIPSSQV